MSGKENTFRNDRGWEHAPGHVKGWQGVLELVWDGKVAKDTVTEGLDGQGGKSGVTCRRKFLKSVEQKSDIIIFYFSKIFPYSMENKEADSKS